MMHSKKHLLPILLKFEQIKLTKIKSKNPSFEKDLG